MINFVPGQGSTIGGVAFDSPHLAGLVGLAMRISRLRTCGAAGTRTGCDGRLRAQHFTGSTGTFQNMWKIVANNITKYRTYPRLVGETGGKVRDRLSATQPAIGAHSHGSAPAELRCGALVGQGPARQRGGTGRTAAELPPLPATRGVLDSAFAVDRQVIRGAFEYQVSSAAARAHCGDAA